MTNMYTDILINMEVVFQTIICMFSIKVHWIGICFSFCYYIVIVKRKYNQVYFAGTDGCMDLQLRMYKTYLYTETIDVALYLQPSWETLNHTVTHAVVRALSYIELITCAFSTVTSLQTDVMDPI